MTPEFDWSTKQERVMRAGELSATAHRPIGSTAAENEPDSETESER